MLGVIVGESVKESSRVSQYSRQLDCSDRSLICFDQSLQLQPEIWITRPIWRGCRAQILRELAVFVVFLIRVEIPDDTELQRQRLLQRSQKSKLPKIADVACVSILHLNLTSQEEFC